MSYFPLKVKDGSGNLQKVGDDRVKPHIDSTTNVHGIADTAALATKTYVDDAIAGVIDAAPAALDTLNELAAALGDDANYASTVTTALSAKAPLESPALTGTPTAPTAAAGTNTTQVATTAFVSTAIANAAPSEGSITSTMIANGTIVDEDISATAAISQSKVSGLTTALDAKPDLFVASTEPGSLGVGDFWLDTSSTV